MKKGIIIFAAAVLLLIAVYMIGSGFTKATAVIIDDYSLSDDGSEMTIDVSVASSVGYIRRVAVHQQHGGKLYLDCYSAFGGINGSIGAKDQYVIPIAGDTEIIAIYAGKNCYREVLRKDASGVWQRV